MPILQSSRNLRSNSVSALNSKSKRNGDVLDSLVWMIAGLLIPAWLLGHLFLTFYPAPVSVGETADGIPEGTAVGKTIDDGAEKIPAAGTLALGNATLPDGAVEADNPLNGQLQSMTAKFDSLTQTSTKLESEVALLKQTNAELADENAALKSQTAQASTMSQDAAPAEDNSEAMNQLQAKFDSSALKLESMQQSLQDATTRLESTENENRTLQTNLANVQTKLEQAEVNLATAVAKNEAGMEIQSESDSDDSPFTSLDQDADAKVVAANEKVAQANTETAEAKAKVTQLEKQLNELTIRLTNTSDAMDVQTAELRDAQLKTQTLLSQNSDLKTALNAARDMAAAAETELPKEVYRDYVSSKGSISKMAFIRWEGEAVIVRSFKNKKLYRLTMDRFSEADKQYLLDLKK